MYVVTHSLQSVASDFLDLLLQFSALVLYLAGGLLYLVQLLVLFFQSPFHLANCLGV